MKSRILIIGLDGASPHLVKRWQSSLPNLSKLMTDGTSGTLWSVTPPRSIPAWYCFATGMNPAKLGVFGFSQRRPQTYDYTFANFTYCQAPPFWDLLNKAGYTTNIAHVPGTFPPRPLHGAMIAGWPGPQNRGNLIYTYPEKLSRELDAELQRPFLLVSPHAIESDNDAFMLQERLNILAMHSQAALHLLQTHPWDTAVVVLSPLDRASHQFWRHMDDTHPQHDPVLAAELGSALQQVYQAHDEQVGRLLELLTPDDYVFVVSDHGFGPSYRTFFINEWLQQEGYLHFHRTDSLGWVNWHKRLLGQMSKPLFWLNNNSSLFRQLIDPFKKRYFSNALRDAYVQNKEKGLVRLNHAPVDWSRTSVYSPDESSLYLNLKGRDPNGIVTPGAEAENLLQEISNKLQKLIDPATGQPIKPIITRKESVYSGPYFDDAPELTIALDDFTTDVMAEIGSGTPFRANQKWSANHNPDGLFIACGPHIMSNEKQDASLYDIAPTVLHLMGSPIPEETDGRVLFDLFDENAPIHQREIIKTAVLTPNQSGMNLSPDELEDIEKQLRDLGYIN